MMDAKAVMENDELKKDDNHDTTSTAGAINETDEKESVKATAGVGATTVTNTVDVDAKNDDKAATKQDKVPHDVATNNGPPESEVQASASNANSGPRNAEEFAQSLVGPTGEDIRPPPLPVRAPVAHNLVPGAYAVGTTLGNTSNGARVEQPANDNDTDMEAGQPNNQDLTEAQPVDDPDNLPMAQQVDEEKLQANRRRENWIHASKWIVFGIAALILLTVTPVVVLKNKSDSTGTGSTTTGAGTISDANVTNAPSPTTQLTAEEEYIFGLLPLASVERIQSNSQSPQSQAFQWLINDPFLSVVVSNNTNSSQSTSSDLYYYPDWRIVQRFALATFYYSSNGPSWYNNNYWLNYTVHECEWFSRDSLDPWPFGLQETFACEGYDNTTRITSSSTSEGYAISTTATAVTTKSNETYTKFWLHENNLQGDDGFPEELFLLTSLTSLALAADPLLKGTIPSAIGQLTNLHSLYMPGLEGLVGSIPTEIGLLTDVWAMLFHNSNLQGEIPSELGLLTNLIYLFLDTNQLTGKVPSEISALSDILRTVYLYGNALTGQLPSELGALTRLRQLSLDENMLSGTIPTEFGLMTDCRVMNPSYNHISGPIPSELGLLSSNLTGLRLGYNDISGTLPTELGLLLKCRDLNAEDNSISGTIPTEIGAMASLRSFFLERNTLSGPLPSEFGLLSDLQGLVVGGNNLTGDIPTELGLLATNGSLLALDLRNNTGFSGTVPDDLCLVGYNVSCPWSSIECAALFACSSDLCGCGNCSCPAN